MILKTFLDNIIRCQHVHNQIHSIGTEQPELEPLDISYRAETDSLGNEKVYRRSGAHTASLSGFINMSLKFTVTKPMTAQLRTIIRGFTPLSKYQSQPTI